MAYYVPQPLDRDLRAATSERPDEEPKEIHR